MYKCPQHIYALQISWLRFPSNLGELHVYHDFQSLFHRPTYQSIPQKSENRLLSVFLNCACFDYFPYPDWYTGNPMCSFLFWLMHCGIWARCIVGFVSMVYWNMQDRRHAFSVFWASCIKPALSSGYAWLIVSFSSHTISEKYLDIYSGN